MLAWHEGAAGLRPLREQWTGRQRRDMRGLWGLWRLEAVGQKEVEWRRRRKRRRRWWWKW